MNTKTLFLFAALTVAAFIPRSSAQLGIKAGVNIASVSENQTNGVYTDYAKKSVIGFQGGLTYDLGVSDMFSIQPELLFIQKGVKSTYILDDANKLESRYYYNYIEVPVLAKIKFYAADKASTGFYFIAGPYLGLAMGGKVATTVTALGVSTERSDDFVFDNSSASARAKRLDYGVAFGGGVKINRLVLDLRYNFGLNNVNDGDALNSNDNKPFIRQRGIGITAGIQF